MRRSHRDLPRVRRPVPSGCTGNSRRLWVWPTLGTRLVFSSLEVSLWGTVSLANSFHISYPLEIRAIWDLTPLLEGECWGTPYDFKQRRKNFPWKKWRLEKSLDPLSRSNLPSRNGRRPTVKTQPLLSLVFLLPQVHTLPPLILSFMRVRQLNLLYNW